MKLTKIAMSAVLFALFATAAHSQTYKADFSTKIILPSGGTDPSKLFTINPPTIGGAQSWTLPSNTGSAAGYVLRTDGSGVLTWVNPATSITLGGDVTGPAGGNSIATGAGLDIVAAINSSGGAGGINGSQVNPAFGAQNISTTGTIGGGAITGTSLTASGGGAITTTGTVSGGTGTFTNLSGTTMTGALAMGGNNITGGGTITGTTITGTSLSAGSGAITGGAITGSGAASLDVSPSTGGANVIGNATSTTALNGAVTFNGTVTLPAGSVTASSLGLTTNHIMVGDASSHAADVAMSQDASILSSGAVTVNGSHAATFAVTNNATVGGTLGVTGTSTLGTVNAGAVTGTSLSAGSGTISTTGAINGGTGTFTGAVGTTGLTNTGTFTQTGNETVSGTSSIDASPSTGGANVIGNSTSTTALNGAVTFNGTVTLPAGSVSASSLSLATGDVLIGDASGHAAAQSLSQDVSVTSGGVATVNGTHAATFAATGNATVAGTLGVTGQTTLGSTVLSPSGTTVSFNSDQADIAPGTSNSVFFISNTDNSAAHSIGGMTGGTIPTGRIIVLINSGTNPITLLNQSTGAVNTQFSIPGGNAIMGGGGSATFIYDGVYWHMTASQ